MNGVPSTTKEANVTLPVVRPTSTPAVSPFRAYVTALPVSLTADTLSPLTILSERLVKRRVGALNSPSSVTLVSETTFPDFFATASTCV